VCCRQTRPLKIKKTIQKTYERKGPEVVQKNFKAVDHSVANLKQVNYPQKVSSNFKMPPIVAKEAPEFVHKVTAEIIAGRGDQLPVSVFPVDGTFPTGTAQWEKRNIAMEIPVWYPDLCIQCNKCTLVCPHAAIRARSSTRSCWKRSRRLSRPSSTRPRNTAT